MTPARKRQLHCEQLFLRPLGYRKHPAPRAILTQVQFDLNKPLVWILVGDKPTPLRSWIAQ
jgi:hypothetical protein